ncbi:MAG: hypothetical protein R2706_07165 [Acidimicrobiales bacterium]
MTDAFSDTTSFADAQLHYQVVEYEQRMPAVLAGSDMATPPLQCVDDGRTCCRGLPSLAAPLAARAAGSSAGQHRRTRRAVGGAVVLGDDDLTAARLASLIDDLHNPAERQHAAEAARSVGRPDAALLLPNLFCRPVTSSRSPSRNRPDDYSNQS